MLWGSAAAYGAEVGIGKGREGEGRGYWVPFCGFSDCDTHFEVVGFIRGLG